MGTRDQSPNKLLASLPQAEYEQIAADLRPVSIRLGQALCRQGRAIRDVFFPGAGAFSLEKVSDDGRVAEIALVGAEGIISAEVFYGTTESPVDCRALVSNTPAFAISADLFMLHVERRGALYNLVVRSQQALVSQIAQTTACSALHSAEQRTCRWLLMVHDRAMCDRIPITPKRLAEMLGIRSQTIARTSGVLTGSGAIAVRHDGFVVVNREKLAAASCECYQTMKTSFQRLLPEIAAAPRPSPASARANSLRITS